MKRRENGMKDMQTQTEEEIEVRFRLYLRYFTYVLSFRVQALREDSAHMRLLRDAKKAADDVLK